MKKCFLLTVFLTAIFSCALFCGCEFFHFHDYDEWMVVKQATCTETGERERYCACGEKQTAIVGALGHDLIVLERAVTATCTEDGCTQAAICSRCDYKTEKILIPAYGHDIKTYQAKQASCTNDGWEGYEACTNCDYSTLVLIPAFGHNYGDWEVLTQPTCAVAGEKVRICENDKTHVVSEVLKKLEHTPEDWVTVTQPTCKSEGLKTISCSECDEVLQSQTITASGHTSGEWTTEVEATCETDGLKTLKCTVCDEVIQTQAIEPSGHDYGDWQTVQAATCLSEGKQIKVCINDDTHVIEEDLPKIDHTESDEITIQPTCEIDGKIYTECTVCKTELSCEILPALSHNFGEWVVVTPATCTQEGSKKRLCKNDESHFEEEEIQASGHIALSQHNENYHFKICELCNIKLSEEPHNFIDNKCTGCDYVIEVINGLDFLLSHDGESYSISSFENDECTQLTIPSTYRGLPIVAVNTGAFRDCKNLIAVILPDTVEVIGENAFYGCESLTEIALSANLKRIEKGAFFNCSKLESITIPASVEYIGNLVFFGCSKLSDVVFEDCEGWIMYNGNNALAYLNAKFNDSKLAAKYFLDAEFYNYVNKKG